MSYTLKYTGAEIDDILDRAVEGGAIDEELALKAPLESPALTGTPTAPTPAESDNSTKVATTAYADRAAAGAAAAAYPVDTASGAIASFADGADSIPMKSFVASIEPIQAGSGDPSPDNIRAISGHSGVNAVVAGKNLISGDKKNYTTNGINLGTTLNVSNKYYVFLKAGKTYRFSGASAVACSWYFRMDYDTANRQIVNSSLTSIDASITVEKDGYARFWVYRSSGIEESDISWFQLEVGESASTYEAYNGTTYPVTFYDGDNPLTVYKGSIDLVSGVLTADSAIFTVNGTESWNESGNRWWKSASSLGVDDTRKEQSICNMATYTDTTNFGAYFIIYSSRIYLNKIASGEVLTDLQARLTANPLQVVYPLATPLVYNLTTEVLSLLGQNNCYNDCGDTAVEYRADIALYVQKLLGGNVSTLAMNAPTPSLSLGRTGGLLEPEALEPVITEDAEPDLAEEEPEAVEEAEE